MISNTNSSTTKLLYLLTTVLLIVSFGIITFYKKLLVENATTKYIKVVSLFLFCYFLMSNLKVLRNFMKLNNNRIIDLLVSLLLIIYTGYLSFNDNMYNEKHGKNTNIFLQTISTCIFIYLTVYQFLKPLAQSMSIVGQYSNGSPVFAQWPKYLITGIFALFTTSIIIMLHKNDIYNPEAKKATKDFIQRYSTVLMIPAVIGIVVMVMQQNKQKYA